MTRENESTSTFLLLFIRVGPILPKGKVQLLLSRTKVFFKFYFFSHFYSLPVLSVTTLILNVQTWYNCFLSYACLVGDQGHRGWFQAAGSCKLPSTSPSTDAGLLAEGEDREAQLQPDPLSPQQEHSLSRWHWFLHTGTQVMSGNGHKRMAV